MADNDSRAKRLLRQPIFPRSHADTQRGASHEERKILEQIVLGAPLPETLNKLCTMIDDGIVNVVAMVSVPDNDESHTFVNAQTAMQVGLKVFCSAAILSRDHVHLGTLEIYGCDSRLPTQDEIQFIDRIAHLAAVALQRHREIGAHERSSRHAKVTTSGNLPEKGFFIN